MKRILMTIIMLLVLLTAGCEMMTPAAVIETNTNVVKLTESVDAYQEIVVGFADQLEKDNLITGKMVDTLEAVSNKVDELQPMVVEGITAVMEAEYSGDKLVDTFIAAKAINKASAPINPYSPILDYGLEILLTIFGVGATGVALNRGGKITIANKQASAAWEENAKVNTQLYDEQELVSIATKKYKAMKQGTEKFKLDNPGIASALFKAIGDAGMRNGGTG